MISVKLETQNKYKNSCVEYDGIKFDSIKEKGRYVTLKRMEENGEITDLKCQVRFKLLPSQKRNGKIIEHPTSYIADFTYIKNGEYVVEDVKGMATPAYILKRKMMLFFHDIKIKEIK